MAENQENGGRLSTAISIVIPVYNEADNLSPLLDRVEHVIASLPQPHQVIVVDDGSTDRTRGLLRQLTLEKEWITAILLSRNFGHQAAVSAGMARANGDVVVILDGDLQDPPELIPTLFESVKSGSDVAYAVRKRRKESWPKRLTYWMFYRALNLLSKYPIPLDTGDFCAMSARVAREINLMPERNRFVRGMRAWVGFRQTSVEYDRDERYAGKSKYNTGRLMRLALDGILSSSDKPLRLASVIGFAVSALAFMFSLFAFGNYFMGRSKLLTGYTSVAVGIFFLGGVQLITIGILGEYIARVFNQVRARPLYIVEEVLQSCRADI